MINKIKKIAIMTIGLSLGFGLWAAQEFDANINEDIELQRSIEESLQSIAAAADQQEEEKEAGIVYEEATQENQEELIKRVGRVYDQQAALTRRLKEHKLIVPKDKADLLGELKEVEDILVTILNKNVLTNEDAQRAQDVLNQVRTKVKFFYSERGRRHHTTENLIEKAKKEDIRAERIWRQEREQQWQRREQFEQEELKEAREQRFPEALEREYELQQEAREQQAAAQRRAMQQEYASEAYEQMSEEISLSGSQDRLQEEAKQAIAEGAAVQDTQDELISLLRGLPAGVGHLVAQQVYGSWLDDNAQVTHYRLELHTKSWSQDVAISSDDTLVATLGDTSVGLFDAATQKRVLTVWDPSEWGFTTIALSKDGRYIAAGSKNGFNGRIHVWDAKTGVFLYTLSTNMKNSISSVAISTRSNFLVTVVYTLGTQVWNPETGQLLRTLSQKGDRCAVISSDEGEVLVGKLDGSVHVFNTQTGALLKQYDIGKSEITSLALSDDDKLLVIGRSNGGIDVLNLQTNEVVWHFSQKTEFLYSVAISADKSFIAASFDEGMVLLWDLKTGELSKNRLLLKSPVMSVRISSDMSFIVTGDKGGNTFMWRLAMSRAELMGDSRINRRLLEAVEQNQGVGVIKELVEQGARPQALLANECGAVQSITQTAQEKLGVEHPVTQYLKAHDERARKERRDAINLVWIKKIVDLAKYLHGESSLNKQEFTPIQKELNKKVNRLLEIGERDGGWQQSDIVRVRSLIGEIATLYRNVRPTRSVSIPELAGGVTVMQGQNVLKREIQQ